MPIKEMKDAEIKMRMDHTTYADLSSAVVIFRVGGCRLESAQW
jgi:hypothetical protein